MSKATSLNAIDNMDINVSQEVENVLAEIASSKNNQIPTQQQQQQHQLPQMIPQQMMPPNQGQQLPPPSQHIQGANPNLNFYPNYPQPPQSGIVDFISNLFVSGTELKFVAIIAALFVITNMQTSIDLLGKYLAFTITDLGNSSMMGNLTRGLIVGLVFIILNKFV